MGVYNEEASLISIIVKISMIILIACLVSITNSLAEKDISSTKQVEQVQVEQVQVEQVLNN